MTTLVFTRRFLTGYIRNPVNLLLSEMIGDGVNLSQGSNLWMR